MLSSGAVDPVWTQTGNHDETHRHWTPGVRPPLDMPAFATPRGGPGSPSPDARSVCVEHGWRRRRCDKLATADCSHVTIGCTEPEDVHSAVPDPHESQAGTCPKMAPPTGGRRLANSFGMRGVGDEAGVPRCVGRQFLLPIFGDRHRHVRGEASRAGPIDRAARHSPRVGMSSPGGSGGRRPILRAQEPGWARPSRPAFEGHTRGQGLPVPLTLPRSRSEWRSCRPRLCCGDPHRCD